MTTTVNKLDYYLGDKFNHFSKETAQSIETSVRVCIDALRLYSKNRISLSFNGGKDACVVLYILLYILRDLSTINVIYFKYDNVFPELTSFLDFIKSEFNLSVTNYTCPYKEGMEIVVKNGVQAVFMGVRRGDPFMDEAGHYEPSTIGWPLFMRVNPIIHWKYFQVWEFLRICQLPYCSLYDNGYTSLGRPSNTVRNEALLSEDGTYLPAYMLKEESLERNCRLLIPKPPIHGQSKKEDGNAVNSIAETNRFRLRNRTLAMLVAHSIPSHDTYSTTELLSKTTQLTSQMRLLLAGADADADAQRRHCKDENEDNENTFLPSFVLTSVTTVFYEGSVSVSEYIRHLLSTTDVVVHITIDKDDDDDVEALSTTCPAFPENSEVSPTMTSSPTIQGRRGKDTCVASSSLIQLQMSPSLNFSDHDSAVILDTLAYH